MANPVFDYTTAEIIRKMREQAHLLNAWMNPRPSPEAIILNECADQLEACVKSSDNIPQT
jgi:hypothetical protein